MSATPTKGWERKRQHCRGASVHVHKQNESTVGRHRHVTQLRKRSLDPRRTAVHLQKSRISAKELYIYKSAFYVVERTLNPQMSPICLSTKDPCVRKNLFILCERVAHPQKRPLFPPESPKSAKEPCIRKRALYLRKSALRLQKSTFTSALTLLRSESVD